ncbi:MAG TPA: 6-phosphofructokinase [Candidatus Monoglobus merdigallinarum]|uniref:ATP-dependent 6-phosphofructokinase n=1 Tax=Candidatus Monoglobus merdigallinarum TaxID=2838698 RepID=A0A9D1PRQ5_9FIRM|nr:6-phosphofructokinase [Candidatus Monoglobus merdigallinarum]
MKKIGILTSGGDCQGLNSAIRGVGKALYEQFGDNVEIYGLVDGYHGLIEGEYKLMSPRDFSGILTIGGTILGTSRQPFKRMRDVDENNVDKVEKMKKTYKKLGLDCIVVLGGNGTHKTANLLSEEGLNVIGLPKTIDNDIWGTDMTFGFYSALNVATDVIDRIHTTATSHGRVFIVEVMGHKVGWLTLYAGIAGGADVILLPEIPYNIDSVIGELERRTKSGKKFSIIAVAEGAVSQEEAGLKKKEFKARRAAMTQPSISYRIADEIKEKYEHEIRVCVPGHFQRGGSPCPYDRVFTTRLGTSAAQLIAREKYGYMVALQKNEIVPVPLSEVAGKLKVVTPDCNEVITAKQMGICFGD